MSLLAVLDLTLRDIDRAQFVRWVVLLTAPTLIFEFVLIWVLAWLTATAVRVVRAALERVEQGDLHSDMVVFDGTESGELQRGFNTRVVGLRQRESVRRLFGQYVGREAGRRKRAGSLVFGRIGSPRRLRPAHADCVTDPARAQDRRLMP